MAAAALAYLLAWLPVDRGCVLLAGEGAASPPTPSELRVVAARARESAAAVALPSGQGASALSAAPAASAVNAAVLARVLGGSVALLCGDVAADPSLAGASGASGASGSPGAVKTASPPVRSLLCAPLIGRQRVLGAIEDSAARDGVRVQLAAH